MKSFLRTFIIVSLSVVVIFIINSCKNKSAAIVLITTNPSEVKQTSAITGGDIKTDNEGSIISRGVCWGTATDPVISNNKTSDGNGAGGFISTLTGLQPGTTYYVRAYACSSTDTAYGSTVSFSTQNYGTVTDIDGNDYKTIVIGTQTWMVNNLRTTKNSDGTAIRLVTDDAKWASLTVPAYCWYNNDKDSYKNTYGALYNGFAASTGKICPTGWHVPGDAEWTTLISYLGGENVAGGKLKQTETSYWVGPNSGATNESGYTALPGGLRYHDGIFHDFGFSGYWWSSTEYSESRAFFRYMDYEYSNVFRFDNLKKIGFSVRCLQDK